MTRYVGTEAERLASTKTANRGDTVITEEGLFAILDDGTLLAELADRHWMFSQRSMVDATRKGAKFDGATDDYAALTDMAGDLSATGGLVRLPQSGTAMVSAPFEVPANVMIEGPISMIEGGSTTYLGAAIRGTSDGMDQVVRFLGANSAARNLLIEGDNLADIAMQADGANFTCEGVRTRGGKTKSAYLAGDRPDIIRSRFTADPTLGQVGGLDIAGNDAKGLIVLVDAGTGYGLHSSGGRTRIEQVTANDTGVTAAMGCKLLFLEGDAPQFLGGLIGGTGTCTRIYITLGGGVFLGAEINFAHFDEANGSLLIPVIYVDSSATSPPASQFGYLRFKSDSTHRAAHLFDATSASTAVGRLANCDLLDGIVSGEVLNVPVDVGQGNYWRPSNTSFLKRHSSATAEVAVSGTAETLVASVTIPGNTWKTEDAYRIDVHGSLTADPSTATNFTMKVTTDDGAGTVRTLLTQTIGSATAMTAGASRNFHASARCVNRSGPFLNDPIMTNSAVLLSSTPVQAPQIVNPTATVTTNTLITQTLKVTITADQAGASWKVETADIERSIKA